MENKSTVNANSYPRIIFVITIGKKDKNAGSKNRPISFYKKQVIKFQKN